MLWVFVCLHLSVAAQGKSVTPAEKAEAKEQAALANQHYTLGRFDAALAEYSRAYELFPAPEFLFNIGQCHKNIKNYDRAIFFFQGFLRQKPNTPNRKLVEELLAQSEQELDREKKAQAAKQREIMAAPVQTRAFTQEPAEPPPPLHKRGWFWGLVGGGVAVAGGITLAVLFIPAPSRDADFVLDLRTK